MLTDGRTDRRTDGQTDGRTEWGIAIALSQIGWLGANNQTYITLSHLFIFTRELQNRKLVSSSFISIKIQGCHIFLKCPNKIVIEFHEYYLGMEQIAIDKFINSNTNISFWKKYKDELINQLFSTLHDTLDIINHLIIRSCIFHQNSAMKKNKK